MSTNHTPVGTAQHASDTLKELAALTEHLERHPGDATWTSGSLLAITSRLAMTLHHLAEAHKVNYAAAYAGTSKSHASGRVLAFNAADEFEQASRALEGVYRHLDRAAHLSSRIDWGEATDVAFRPRAPHVPTRTVPAMRRADVGLTR